MIEFDEAEVVAAMNGLADACTLELSTLPLGDHLEAYIHDAPALGDCLAEIRELAQERHRQVQALHRLQFGGEVTHNANRLWSANTEGLRPC